MDSTAGSNFSKCTLAFVALFISLFLKALLCLGPPLNAHVRIQRVPVVVSRGRD